MQAYLCPRADAKDQAVFWAVTASAATKLEPDSCHREYYNDFWRRQEDYLHPHAELRLRHIDALVQRWLRIVGPIQGDATRPRICDLGCGTGWLSHYLTAYGSVTGVEPSSMGIHRARSRYGTSAELQFVVGTATTLLAQGQSGFFDLVVTSEVIEHVIDQEKFLREIFELLKPNGFVILSTPREETKMAWLAAGAEQQPIENWLTRAELLRLARDCHFRVITHEVDFIEFTRRGLYRLLVSQKVQRLCQVLSATSMLDAIRKRYALYQFVLLNKDS